MQVDVYDPSFFVAFGFATEKPITLAGGDTKGCTADVTRSDVQLANDALVQRGQNAATAVVWRRPRY